MADRKVPAARVPAPMFFWNLNSAESRSSLSRQRGRAAAAPKTVAAVSPGVAWLNHRDSRQASGILLSATERTCGRISASNESHPGYTSNASGPCTTCSPTNCESMNPRSSSVGTSCDSAADPCHSSPYVNSPPKPTVIQPSESIPTSSTTLGSQAHGIQHAIAITTRHSEWAPNRKSFRKPRENHQTETSFPLQSKKTATKYSRDADCAQKSDTAVDEDMMLVLITPHPPTAPSHCRRVSPPTSNFLIPNDTCGSLSTNNIRVIPNKPVQLRSRIATRPSSRKSRRYSTPHFEGSEGQNNSCSLSRATQRLGGSGVDGLRRFPSKNPRGGGTAPAFSSVAPERHCGGLHSNYVSTLQNSSVPSIEKMPDATRHHTINESWPPQPCSHWSADSNDCNRNSCQHYVCGDTSVQKFMRPDSDEASLPLIHTTSATTGYSGARGKLQDNQNIYCSASNQRQFTAVESPDSKKSSNQWKNKESRSGRWTRSLSDKATTKKYLFKSPFGSSKSQMTSVHLQDFEMLSILHGRSKSAGESVIAIAAKLDLTSAGAWGSWSDATDEQLTLPRSRTSGFRKWLRRHTSGQCELERLCGTCSPHNVERSLLLSRRVSPEDKRTLLRLQHDVLESRFSISDVQRPQGLYTGDQVISGVRVQATSELTAVQSAPVCDRTSKYTESDQLGIWYDEADVHSICSSTAFRECISRICKQKSIRAQDLFEAGFARNWSALRGLSFSLKSLRTLQQNTIDAGNIEHEKMFASLWDALLPDRRLSGRMSKDWKLIGFQGEDPATDFRGCGVLGLENLTFFATYFSDDARRICNESNSDHRWYSFAITGINISSWVWEWLALKREVSRFFYAVHDNETALLTFNYLYSYTFLMFHRFWVSKQPASIMDFPFIAAEFREYVTFPPQVPACCLLEPHISTPMRDSSIGDCQMQGAALHPSISQHMYHCFLCRDLGDSSLPCRYATYATSRTSRIDNTPSRVMAAKTVPCTSDSQATYNRNADRCQSFTGCSDDGTSKSYIEMNRESVETADHSFSSTGPQCTHSVMLCDSEFVDGGKRALPHRAGESPHVEERPPTFRDTDANCKVQRASEGCVLVRRQPNADSVVSAPVERGVHRVKTDSSKPQTRWYNDIKTSFDNDEMRRTSGASPPAIHRKPQAGARIHNVSHYPVRPSQKLTSQDVTQRVGPGICEECPQLSFCSFVDASSSVDDASEVHM